MALRDILVTVLVLGLAAYTLKRPYVGVLLMSWIGYMNPHRLTWGFAYSMPFAFIAAGVTAFVLVFTKERQLPPNWVPVRFWVAFIVWVSICSLFAVSPDDALGEYTRFIKIQIGILFTLMLIRTPQQIRLLVAVITFSVGFYGIKGGFFTVITGGNFRVWGPPDSFVEGNNEIGLGLLMVLPLMYFFYMYPYKRWLKPLFALSMLLTLAAIVGTHSRGALVGLICTCLFLWWHSRHKLPLALAGLVLIIVGLQFVPEHWWDRMATIQNYEEDASAMGRINAWTVGFNVALNHFFGGGFGVFWQEEIFVLYAPDPLDIHDAHSIYFEVLGEQGIIGLILFIGLWLSTWRMLSRTASLAVRQADTRWMNDLARMIKVSLVAYATGGAFLGLGYWDLPYHFFALAILMRLQLPRHQASGVRGPATPRPAPETGASSPPGLQGTQAP